MMQHTSLIKSCEPSCAYGVESTEVLDLDVKQNFCTSWD